MPLYVYMYAKPPDKVVRINDAYFLANTKLEDTEQCRRILRIIDQAEYCSEKTFIGRDKSLGALFTDNLSTGTKTLLNISQHRDLCFDTIECGNNALTLLMGFTEGQAVLHPGVVWDPDIWDSLGVLDVVFDGNHFTDLCAISSYMQEMRCRYD